MKRLSWLSLAAPLLLFLAACSPAANLQVEETYVGGWYDGPVEGIAVVMTSPHASYLQLVDSVHLNAVAGLSRHPYARARYDLVERSEIELVLEEARLGSGGFVDTNTAPQLGQLVGADYIIMVGITMVDARPAAVRGVQLGSVRLGASGVTLTIGLTMRMIDTTTGRTLSTGYGEATSMVMTGLSLDRTEVGGPATVGMVQEMLPEVVARSLNDLFRNLDR